MDNFFTILYKAAIRDDIDLLEDYDSDDLKGMISLERPPSDVHRHFMKMASEILALNGSASEVKSIAIQYGLKDKFCAKIKNHWDSHQVEVIGLKAKDLIDGTNRYKGMQYSLRTKFYTKKDEFKGQKKYATIRFMIGGEKDGSVEPLVLNCQEQNLKKIKKRLDGIHKKLSTLFEDDDDEESDD
jgi:hypothetical protein